MLCPLCSSNETIASEPLHYRCLDCGYRFTVRPTVEFIAHSRWPDLVFYGDGISNLDFDLEIDLS